MKFCVVDESPLLRELLGEGLVQNGGDYVAGFATLGQLWQRFALFRPDVIIVQSDVYKLESGLANDIQKSGCRILILGSDGGGGLDCIPRPLSTTPDAIRSSLRIVLPAAFRRLQSVKSTKSPSGVFRIDEKPIIRPSAPPVSSGLQNASRRGADVVLVGVSTGGPQALGVFLSGLPWDLNVPVVVVQHIPLHFSKTLAETLGQSSILPVVVAVEGDRLVPNTVYLADGGRHLEIHSSGTELVFRYTDAPPVQSCRPSVDVLFQSFGRIFHKNAVAVVLTGMGSDGCEGARVLRSAGASILVQDEQSSVVWGMPKAVVDAGLAHAVLPIEDLAAEVLLRVRGIR